MDPKIFIGIDNCFAIKRWTTPDEWARVIKDMGLKYIECVTDIDNEPLLMPQTYLDEWVADVNKLKALYDVELVMLYSNNSTYDTTGLAHPDARVRAHIIDNWLHLGLNTARAIDAGLGYFIHAFPENILFDRASYDLARENMLESCVKVNRAAAQIGVKHIALEQMYTPHQIPFTIDGTRELMRHVLRESGHPLYFTEDVGHHCPFYLKPGEEKLQAAFSRYKKDGYVELWLGGKEAYKLFTEARGDSLSCDVRKAILEDMENNGHLFNEPKDTDCYRWLSELGCYSPVIHLQQTDGARSSHADFTPESNKIGIIHPVKVLRALQESYRRVEEKDMPPRCGEIYLMLELYINTAEIGYQGLYRMSKSAEYWREFIPEDGMRLSRLIELNKNLVL